MLEETEKRVAAATKTLAEPVGAPESDIIKEFKSHGTVDHVEDGKANGKYGKYRAAGLSEDDAAFLAGFSPAQERAIYRKIDFRVVPLLSLLYLISHLDRANIGE